MCVTGSSSNIRFNALSLAQLVFYQLGYVFCHRQQFPSVYSPHVVLKSAQSCGDTSIFDLFAAGLGKMKSTQTPCKLFCSLLRMCNLGLSVIIILYPIGALVHGNMQHGNSSATAACIESSQNVENKTPLQLTEI